MSTVRIAVIGTRGQIARSLIERGAEADVEVAALGRPVLDLADPHTIEPALAGAAADVLVNAAAYTDVERAESEPGVAEAINAQGAGVLAAWADRRGIPIIHLSTDYVFDGRKAEPYCETDPIDPLNAYGRTKAKGEQAVATANRRHAILRTSWVYSPFGRNFVRTMLERASEQQDINVVCDQFGCPTSAADMADGVVAVARKLAGGGDDDRHGVFHMAAAGAASWAEFAAAIFAISAERGGPCARVVPVPSSEHRMRALRPANSRLDCSKLAAVYGIELPPWRRSLVGCIDRILEQRQ